MRGQEGVISFPEKREGSIEDARALCKADIDACTHTHIHSPFYSCLITHKPGDKISVKDFLLNVRRGVLQWFSPYTIVVNGLEIRM